MIMWLVDGHLCDGGPHGYAYDKSVTQLPVGGSAGWSLFDPLLGALKGDGTGGGAARASTRVATARVYNRAMYTSEVIGNFRAGVTVSE